MATALIEGVLLKWGITAMLDRALWEGSHFLRHSVSLVPRPYISGATQLSMSSENKYTQKQNTLTHFHTPCWTAALLGVQDRISKQCVQKN